MNKRCFAEAMAEIGNFFDIVYPGPSLGAVWQEVEAYDDAVMPLVYSRIVRDHLPHHRLPAGSVGKVIHEVSREISIRQAKRREDEWTAEKRSYSGAIGGKGWTQYDRDRFRLCLEIIGKRLDSGTIAHRLDKINDDHKQATTRRDTFVAVNSEVDFWRKQAT